MIHLLFFLSGIVIPSAHAQTLINAGQGGPGVGDMWDMICGVVLPCDTTVGAGGSTLVLALAAAIVNFLFPLISIVAVCMVIYAGIKIISSNGSEDKIGEAKKIIMYAAGGVILSLMTTAALDFVVWYLQDLLS